MLYPFQFMWPHLVKFLYYTSITFCIHVTSIHGIDYVIDVERCFITDHLTLNWGKQILAYFVYCHLFYYFQYACKCLNFNEHVKEVQLIREGSLNCNWYIVRFKVRTIGHVSWNKSYFCCLRFFWIKDVSCKEKTNAGEEIKN